MIFNSMLMFTIVVFSYGAALAVPEEEMAAEEECSPQVTVIPLNVKKGDAAPEEVLEGRTFTNKDAVDISGTMVNQGAVNILPKTYNQPVPEGYHNGSGGVQGDRALVPENIRSGTSVFGVTGTSIQAGGNATADQVLDGQSFSNSSGGKVGTMANQEGRSFTPATAEQSIPAGSYNGSGVVHGDGALVPENIRFGATLFGVAGQAELVDTTSGDALAGELRLGKKAWVDGIEVTGSMVDSSGEIIPSATDTPIPAGYHDGTGVVKTDPAFVSMNIRSGIEIFEEVGAYKLPEPVEEGTVTSATGRIWMNRNLGASRVATSSTDTHAYGDLYQWGRLADGHEYRYSPTVKYWAQSVGDTPGHGWFWIPDSGWGDEDWRQTPNNTLWQGVEGINNPCPAGFRVPTATEWQNEMVTWSSRNAVGAFNSPLKLVPAGRRIGTDFRDGVIWDAGSEGHYWTTNVSGSDSVSFYFTGAYARAGTEWRTYGLSVRCIKD